MSNKYAGICYKCGQLCEPGDGVFEKVSKAAREKWPGLPRHIRWQVQHHECVWRYSKTAHHVYNPEPPIDPRLEGENHD